MKVVFMGTPDFAVGALEALIEAGHQVSAVVTQPDKEKGRGKEISFPPVKECALAHHIPVFQPVRIKRPEAVEELRKFEADIFVVAAFGQILSKEILDMPKYGCINIHASLLPKYRGAAPIQWAIINGDSQTGVTIMQMNEGLDTGDMLTKCIVPIEAEDTGESLFNKLSTAGAKLLVDTLPQIEAGTLTPEPQDESLATHVKMLTKSMGRMDFTKSADTLEHLVRGLNSWPSAFCRFRGKNMKIWKSSVMTKDQMEEMLQLEEAESEQIIDAGKSWTDVKPGTVVYVSKDAMYVKTGLDYLKLTEVQLESKKRMAVKDFLLGVKVCAGEYLED